MPIVPGGFVHQAQLAADIAEAIRQLPKDEVSHVSYVLRPDSTDDPSIYFRVVLTDSASRLEMDKLGDSASRLDMDKLGEVTRRVAATLIDAIHPLENWGLFPYFNFRSESEQRKRSGTEQW